MKFNLSELERLFYEIQEIIDYVEFSNFDKRNFNLFLGNGEKLNYRLSKEHIPHLLGINTNYLTSTGLYKKQNSYDVLKEFIQNPYSVNGYYQQGIISYDSIFSEYIYDKIKVFKSNISPNIYETEFVCKYEASRSYMSGNNTFGYDYIIAKKIKETENYAILCLVDNGYNKYAAMSSIYFENKESMINYLSEIVKNQEITLLSGVRSVGIEVDYERLYNLKPDDLIPKIKGLQDYKTQFKCIPDTTGKHIYCLEETVKHKDKYLDNYDLIGELTEAIINAKLVDRNKFIGTFLIDLADAHNNSLCNIKENINAQEAYSDIVIERDALIKELSQVKDIIETLKQKVSTLEDENDRLSKENDFYKAKEDIIIKTLRPSGI